MNALLLRDVELNGVRTHVRVEHGLIADIGASSPARAEEIDARGGALLPGLIDHHIHLFATAARLASVDLSDARTTVTLLSKLRDAAKPGQWLRAIGYDDSEMGLISREDLDQIGGVAPIRVQDRTGALWVLNSAALAQVLGDDEPPLCVERDANGRPNGRIWRGDAWLRQRINAPPPSLAPLSRALAARGVTGVTDASVTNGPQEAALLAQARTSGDLLQSLCLMSGDDIPLSSSYEIGPLKILPDERNLPDVEEVMARMRRARHLKRAVAVHCVTAAELVLALAAFESIGARDGDRIEHGGVIPVAMIETIRALGLTIVSQPHFITERGDRYRRTIDIDEQGDLYRLRSLRAAGVKLAAGSDAPYGGIDPWRAMSAAASRQTESGAIIGADERLEASVALGLYLGDFHDPGGAPRAIAIGRRADLCLLRTPLAKALATPESTSIAVTIAGGEIIHRDL